MQTQGLTSHLDRGNGSVPATCGDPARRLAVSALVVGVALGAWSGWGLERIIAMAPPSAPSAAAAPMVAAPAIKPAAASASTGRSLAAEIPVYSGRFAGVIQTPALDDRVTAELRISDPLHTGDKAVVRTVTIDQR